MTNREKLNAMTDRQLVDLFCSAMEKIADKTNGKDWCCDICPVSNLCKGKNNGFLK